MVSSEAFLVIGAALLSLAVVDGQELPLTVTTKTGRIRGQLINVAATLQVYQFTGIPFAEPPIGPNRFRKPVPKRPWQGIFDATEIANSCPQLSVLTIDPSLANNSVVNRGIPKGRQSEDCLYLNIWVPKGILDKLATEIDEPPPTLAVLVFIHGGAFTMGATSIDMFNGSVLAAYNNIVVATIQYRLGSLGFAYLGNDEVPGNMGLWDQLEAMKWLCENIGSFGGNCSETTIGGVSAGAVSVTYHLLSPLSRRYFKRAIVQSGTAISPWAQHTAENAKTGTSAIFTGIAQAQCRLAQNVGANQILSCLRQIDSATFPIADGMAALRGVSMGPVIDGDFIPRDPGKMLEAGQFYRAPLLIGANKDEGSMFIMLNPDAQKILPRFRTFKEKAMLDALNFTHYLDLLAAGFKMFSPGPVDPLLFGAVEFHYWPAKHEGFPVGKEIIEAAVAATGDYSLACPTLTWVQVASTFDQMGSQIYAYYFTQRRAEHPWPVWTGVQHGDELPFIFGEPIAQYARGYGYSYDDKMLSRVMMALWTNFIKYGDPNIRDVETLNIAYGPLQQRPWKPYVGEQCPYQVAEMNALAQVYQYGPGLICGLKTRDCLFWDLFFPKLAEKLSTNHLSRF